MKSINVHPSVHKDVSERLQKIDKQLYDKVNQVLKVNKAERHIRGGLATKHKYEEAKKQTDKVYIV